MLNEPVQDGVCQSRLPDPFVPVLPRNLAGDDRGASRVAIFQHLEQIMTLCLGRAPEAQVVGLVKGVMRFMKN